VGVSPQIPHNLMAMVLRVKPHGLDHEVGKKDYLAKVAARD